jgi:hypothetical protein
MRRKRERNNEQGTANKELTKELPSLRLTGEMLAEEKT